MLGVHDGVVCVDATGRHAVVFCLDHHGHAKRFEHALDRLGDLFGHPFLDLEAARKGVHHAGKLGDTHHTAFWQGRPFPIHDEKAED